MTTALAQARGSADGSRRSGGHAAQAAAAVPGWSMRLGFVPACGVTTGYRFRPRGRQARRGRVRRDADAGIRSGRPPGGSAPRRGTRAGTQRPANPVHDLGGYRFDLGTYPQRPQPSAVCAVIGISVDFVGGLVEPGLRGTHARCRPHRERVRANVAFGRRGQQGPAHGAGAAVPAGGHPGAAVGEARPVDITPGTADGHGRDTIEPAVEGVAGGHAGGGPGSRDRDQAGRANREQPVPSGAVAVTSASVHDRAPEQYCFVPSRRHCAPVTLALRAGPGGCAADAPTASGPGGEFLELDRMARASVCPSAQTARDRSCSASAARAAQRSRVWPPPGNGRSRRPEPTAPANAAAVPAPGQLAASSSDGDSVVVTLDNSVPLRARAAVPAAGLAWLLNSAIP